MLTVNFKKYFPEFVYLNERPKGEDMRKKLKLDEVDDKKESVEFYIDKDWVGMNISFFLGLFSETILKCGVKDFRERYVFKYESPEINKELFDLDIEYGIKKVLSDITPENIINKLKGTNNV